MPLALGQIRVARTVVFMAACSALVGCALRDRLASSTPPEQAVFAPQHPDLTLSFTQELQEVHTLPDGRVMYRAHGTVTNKSSVALDVPILLVVLRDKNNRIILT